MATMVTGLGGPAGYGENVFSSTPLVAGNLDDGSVYIDITSVFGAGGINFFGTNYTGFYLNTNGLITFTGPETAYTPVGIAGYNQPAIAPFWSDIDINKGGEIYWDIDTVNDRITITWDSVAPYSGTGTDSFQLIIESTGGGDFTIDTIYEQIQWTDGYTGDATVGVTDGGANDYEIEGSGDPAVLSTYANNDFDTGEPIGIWDMAFDGGNPVFPDGIVDGTAGADLIDASYTGDPETDVIDGTDWTGPAGNEDWVEAGAGQDTVYAGLENDTIFGGTGDDQLYGEAANDLIYGDGGTDSLFGGAGDDTLHGGISGGAGIGGTDTVASTYTLISLGNFADIDANEADGGVSENAANLIGSYGGLGSELYNNFVTATANDTNGNNTLTDNDGGATPETFTIGGTQYALDSTQVYNATVTFTDGSTGNFTAVVVQLTNGDVYMMPEFSNNADNVLLTSQPIQSISLNTVSVANSGLTANRVNADYQVPADDSAADYLDGGTGDDLIYGTGGDDTIALGDNFGNDTIVGGETFETTGDILDMSGMTVGAVLDLSASDPEIGTVSDGAGGTASFDQIEGFVLGAGNDTITLGDGSGSDTVQGFSAPTANGDGTFTGADQIDVSGMTDGTGNPVDTRDVTVSDDGSGNAVLTFPNGESLTLIGVSPTLLMSGQALNAIGVPINPDGYVDGTAGDDVIDASYAGDLDGDRVDGGDAILPGETGDDDIILAGAGNDSVVAGAGNDEIYGDAGNDTLVGGLGADEYYGGIGDDTLYLAEGDTAFGGAGDDLFILTDLGEASFSTITIDGNSETGSDTLDFNGLADRTTLTRTDDGSGSFSGSVTMLDGTVVNFSEIENIICFTPGTRILTEAGERPIETLRPGDRIVTRDDGLQPLRWIGRKNVQGYGNLAPILIEPRAAEGATRPLLVSPQHRMLIAGYRAQLLFGQDEVLIAAKHLVDGTAVRPQPLERVTYIHLMFDRHQVIFANGAATESFHLGDIGLDAVGEESREEIFRIFPHLRANIGGYGDTARPCLKHFEASLLRPPVAIPAE